jgi:N-acetylmuramic acid 6-phosphate etherase
MTTETVSDLYQGLDAWSAGDIMRAITEGNARAVRAVESALPRLEAAAAGIEPRLRAGGRLFYAGAGTSGRLGVMDAAELAPTFGFDRTEVLLAGGGDAQEKAQEGAEDDVAAAAAAVDRAAVGPDDALIGVAASGRTPYTVAAVKRARERGAFTVGLANNADTPLLTVGDVGVLLDTGPEVLAGSTRLAAGTAQKAALNAISTAVLVRLGGAYDNLMVGMRPLNAKLKKRAVEIVAQAAGLESSQAEAVLDEAGGDIRTAIVMAGTGRDSAAAGSLLVENGYSVRAAIAAAVAPGRRAG